MDDNTSEFHDGFSPGDPPGNFQAHQNNSHNNPQESLLISHAISGQLKLNAASREQLANFAQYFDGSTSLSLTAALISLAGYEFKTHKELAAIRADNAAMKGDIGKIQQNVTQSTPLSDAQKADLRAAAKYVILDPTRHSYHNDALVRDIMVYLNKHSQTNSFTSFFANENSVFRQTIEAKGRKDASYAKRILKEQWIITTLDPVTAVGVTGATETVLTALLKTTEPMGVQQVARMLTARAFLRGRQILLQKPPVEGGIKKKTKKRRKKGDNFETASNDGSEDDEDKEDADLKAFWGDFDRFLKAKIEGRRVVSAEGTESWDPKGWGKSFISKEWSEYYVKLATEEWKLFPDDSIPLIPRQTPPPAVSTPVPPSMVNGATPPLSAQRSHISLNGGLFASTRSNSPAAGSPLANMRSSISAPPYGHAFPGYHGSTAGSSQPESQNSDGSQPQWPQQSPSNPPAGLRGLLHSFPQEFSSPD